MKIRLGFVSNSSSCSFTIVTKKKYLDWVVIDTVCTDKNKEYIQHGKRRLRDLGEVHTVENLSSVRKVFQICEGNYPLDPNLPDTHSAVRELLSNGDEVVVVFVKAGNDIDIVSEMLYYEEFSKFNFPPECRICDIIF